MFALHNGRSKINCYFREKIKHRHAEYRVLEMEDAKATHRNVDRFEQNKNRQSFIMKFIWQESQLLYNINETINYNCLFIGSAVCVRYTNAATAAASAVCATNKWTSLHIQSRASIQLFGKFVVRANYEAKLFVTT